MNTVDCIAEGIKIFRTYYPNFDLAGADHDVIYFDGNGENVTSPYRRNGDDDGEENHEVITLKYGEEREISLDCKISKEDLLKLNELGFLWSDTEDCWRMYV